MAFNKGTAANGANGADVTSVTFNYTVTGNSDRILYMGASLQHYPGTTTVSSMTYNGTGGNSINTVWSDGGIPRTGASHYFWYDSALPGTGQNSCVITAAATCNTVAGWAMDIDGRAQSGQPTDEGTDMNAGGTSASVSLTGLTSGAVMLDTLSRNDADNSPTVGANQTEETENQFDFGASADEGTIIGSSEEVSGTSGTMSMSWTGAEQMGYLAAAFDPVGGGVSGHPQFYNRRRRAA